MLAEKVDTALERAPVNTRWRDFADIYLLANAHTISALALSEAVHTVADHRGVPIRPLRQVLNGYGELAHQPDSGRPASWRRSRRLARPL